MVAKTLIILAAVRLVLLLLSQGLQTQNLHNEPCLSQDVGGVSNLRLQLAGWSLFESQWQLLTGVQRLLGPRLAARSKHLLLLGRQSLHPTSMASGHAACGQGRMDFAREKHLLLSIKS